MAFRGPAWGLIYRPGGAPNLATRQCQTCLVRLFTQGVVAMQQQQQQQSGGALGSSSPDFTSTPKPIARPTSFTPGGPAQSQSPSLTRPTAVTAQSAATADPDHEGFVPRPLGQPIGLPESPLVALRKGLVDGKEKKKKESFLSYERNQERRKELTQEFTRSYFQDFSNLKYHKGKTFLANPRIFKSAAALYFPNFRGITLQSSSTVQNTAERLENKITIVAIASNLWAKEQVDSFIGRDQNPELHKLMEQNGDLVQTVEITVETSFLRSLLQRLFFFRLRRERQKDTYGNYFLVRTRTPGQVREAIGLMNEKVGYVYLVDQAGKIRWAASAQAEGEETKYLVKGLQKLLQNARAEGDGGGSGSISGENIRSPIASPVL